MIRQLKVITTALLLSLPILGHARIVHIIHTNDLHSYFKGYYNGTGGYARVLTKIKELKAESAAQGVEVLHLDGGDWGEGTSFFLSDKGAASIQALGMMGVEVAVIGNHDHMMGGNILGQQIRRANVATKFISANIVKTPSMNLGELVTPYVDITKAEIPIRVIGLSTAQAHYQYQMFPGYILPPTQVGARESAKARKAGKKLIIALTHIGVSADEKLVRGSREIDVVVGGHSHTRLDQVRWAKNLKGKMVPIVQAASHGLVVGSLTLDVKDDGNVEVVNYKLHDVSAPMREDAKMAAHVLNAADDRNQYFGGRWNDIIGETQIPLSGHVNGRAVLKETCWGKHMAKMSKEVADADVGVHLASFEGMYMPPGTITFGDMVDNFPHFRKYGDPGWQISTILVRGIILKPIMLGIYQLRNQLGVNFNGLSYNVAGDKAVDFKVNGYSINNKALYRVAFPAEIGYALKLTLPWVTARLFPSLRNTGKYYWTSMEEYIKVNSPITCF